MARPEGDPSFTIGEDEYWIADVGSDKPGIDSEYSTEAGALNLTLRVDWNRRRICRRRLLGNTFYVHPPGAQFGHLSRELPHRFLGEEDWLWCKRATVSPEVIRTSPGNGVPGALFGIIKARYERPNYELLEDNDVISETGFPDESLLKRYISRIPPRSKDRVLATRGGGWRFVDRAEAIPLPIGITVNESEEVYIWNQVPLRRIPRAAISALWRASNETVFDGWPVKTLVFSDYSFQECPCLPNGELAVNVRYVFTRKPAGANFFPDPLRGHRFFEVIAFDGSLNQPHPAGEFRALFRPAA